MSFKKIKKILISTIFAINIVTLFIFLLSSFSDRVSPNTMMLFAYLGLLFPLIFFINILFAIWWTLLFQWKFLLTNIIVFIVCSGAIFTYFPVHIRTKEVPEDCIKVLTYNVMRFNQYKNHTNEKNNNLISYILDLDADIVFVYNKDHEVGNEWSKLTERVYKTLKPNFAETELQEAGNIDQEKRHIYLCDKVFSAQSGK